MKKIDSFFIALLFGFLPFFLSAQVADIKGGALGIERVAAKANHAQYESVRKTAPDDTCWVQIDLQRSYPIELVKLFPVVDDSWDYYARPRFPVRFRIETSDYPDFREPKLIADQCATDYPVTVIDKIDNYRPAQPVNGRYVRLTVTKLPEFGKQYYFDLWRIEVWSNGCNVAEDRLLADSDRGFLGKHPLLKAPRPMGEGSVLDCPENVTDPENWHPVKPILNVPTKGITIEKGLFRKTMDANARYLLSSFSVDDMLRKFRIRAGQPAGGNLRDLNTEWVNILPGSIAGRYLMGAGNHLRWIENKELRERMNEVVNGIDSCKDPNGYIMAYPEEEILFFENGGYCRSWVTQGLIEAGIAGNTKTYPLLRNFYDWFDKCPYLPELVRRGGQGRQGVIASTRMYFTPVGLPKDLQVVQRYYQEDFWMKQLSDKDVDAIWKYPYDRPHCYLILSLESFLDLYMATGDEKYLDAAIGGWELYNAYFEHIGGSIASASSLPILPNLTSCATEPESCVAVRSGHFSTSASTCSIPKMKNT